MAEALFALWAAKELLTLFMLILGNFWCSVVSSVTFSSNLSDFEKNPENPKKNQKMSKKKFNQEISKIPKISKNLNNIFFFCN